MARHSNIGKKMLVCSAQFEQRGLQRPGSFVKKAVRKGMISSGLPVIHPELATRPY